MKAIIFALIVAFLGAANAAVGSSCFEGEPASYDSVIVKIGDIECTEEPCALTRGQDACAYITFTTKKETSELFMKANATVTDLGGITTPYPIPDGDNGCNYLQDGAYCPLDEEESAVIQICVPVSTIFPKVHLKLLLHVLDEASAMVTCFQLLGVVTDPA